MKHIIIVLIFSIILFPFHDVKASTTNPINPIYVEYDSFQKRYHDFVTELSYYMGASYNQNDHYFKENMNFFREKVNNALGDNQFSQFLTSQKGLDSLSKPIAFLSALPDVRKYLWDKVKNIFNEPDPDNYIEGLSTSSWGSQAYIFPPNGYLFRGSDGNNYNHIYFTFVYTNNAYFLGFQLSGNGNPTKNSTHNVEYDYPTHVKVFQNNGLPDLPTLLNLYFAFPDYVALSVVKDNEVSPIQQQKTPQQITNIYNRTVNNFNEGRRFDENYTPNVTPFLSCPNTNNNLDLKYDDGIWYGITKETARVEKNNFAWLFGSPVSANTNVTIIINSEGKTIHNGEECELDFKFPNIQIHINGDISSDGESILRMPNDVPPSEEMDDSILGYIREAYEFATKSINTGVEGLKSILLGTVGLISIVTAFFDFLPPELLTLFIGGFSIALGLWVFKR